MYMGRTAILFLTLDAFRVSDPLEKLFIRSKTFLPVSWARVI
jgi:hypothetical protein